jgi:hypothetical protein
VLLTPRGAGFVEEVEERQIVEEEEVLILPRKKKTYDSSKEKGLQIAQGKRQWLIMLK